VPAHSTQVKPPSKGSGTTGEAEDREELEGAIEIGGLHLDAGMLEHQNKSETNAGGDDNRGRPG